MARLEEPTAHKPATKFAHLRKKMDQSKLRGNVKKQNICRSPGR